MMRRCYLLLSTAFLLLPAGCGSSTAEFSEERQVPRSHRPMQLGQSHAQRFGLSQPEAASSASGAAESRWTADAPVHWEVGPKAQFRDLRWFIGGDQNAEVYLLASVGGSLRQNVDRWYQDQFATTPPTSAEIATLPTYPLLGLQATLFEVQGTFRGRPDTKMLVLAAHEVGQLRATLRMTAPSTIADLERENFLAVAASLRQGDGDEASAPQSAGQGQKVDSPMLAGHPPAAAPFRAEIPASWTAMGDTGSRMLRHSFGAGGKGEVYVGMLGGDPFAMAPIWYGELGQQPPSEADFQSLARQPLLGSDAYWIDLRGAYRGMSGDPIEDARLLVAVVKSNGGVVFVKMVGPGADVDREEAAFRAFCQSMTRTDG
jgi:hypothetical protein